MSKHRDPKTVMCYDHGRENLEQNADNFLGYDEEWPAMRLAVGAVMKHGGGVGRDGTPAGHLKFSTSMISKSF